MPKRDLKFNVNDYVRIKLRGDGLYILKAHYERLGLAPEPYLEMLRRPDKDAYTMPLWEFMMLFGPHTRMGPTPPFVNDILLVDVEVPDA